MSFNEPNFDYQGDAGLSIEDYGEIVTNKIGLSSGTCVWKCAQAGYLQGPRINSAHPIATYLICTKIRCKFQNGVAVFTCDYEGVPIAFTGEVPVAAYELAISCSEEPIETNPYFLSFAGTAQAPLNGATFEDLGGGTIPFSSTHLAEAGYHLYRFKEFQVTTDGSTLNRYAGIIKYLESTQLTWRQSYVVPLNTTELGLLGSIDTPIGPHPNFTGRNWLYVGASQTQRGSAFQVTKEWRLSGRRGWDPHIYATG